MLLSFELLTLFSFFISVVFSQCSYSTKSGTLNLNSISGKEYSLTIGGFQYFWTACSNGYSCSGSNVMAAQFNAGNSKCNVLGSWDGTSNNPPTYHSDNETWIIEYNNGASCGTPAAPRNLELRLQCTQSSGVSFYNVVNPSGTCEYDYYLSGSVFCPVGGGSSSSSGGGGLSGGSVFLIILLVVTVVYCVAGIVYNKQKNQERSWADRNNIPNYTFWATLPKWTWAGCCVTKEWISSKIGNKGEAHTPLPSDGN